MALQLLYSVLFACATFASVETHLLERKSNWTVGQSVQTTSGLVFGKADIDIPDVSNYFGIPYAKPPVGDLRFARPQLFSSNGTINGTDFGPSCPISSNYGGSTKPNFTDDNLTVLGEQLVDFLAQKGDIFSEDCLTLNVWTRPQKGSSKKAVMVWIVGGGWTTGATNYKYGVNGVHLVDEEDVIFVSLNYRLNIFGFPGNPDGPNNLGLLDQRLAIEWVRDNIEAFGGDPNRIILFGQSAGASSIDLYSYAYVSDPIAYGFIMQSGTVGLGQYPPEASAQAWFAVTSILNCGNSTTDPSTVLSCMRNKSTEEISQAIPLQNLPGGSALFWPTVDEHIVFSDYPARAANGSFSQVPVLLGSTDFESGFTQAEAYIYDIQNEVNQTFFEISDLTAFTCPSAARANATGRAGLPVWRYRWFGNFPDLVLQTNPNSGAYHSSEISPLFGRYSNGTGGIPPSTGAEIAIGSYIRGAWAAFAKDPVHGLSSYQGGWPTWNPHKDTLVRLAFDNKTGDNLGTPARYDLCPEIVAFEGSPASAGTSPTSTGSSSTMTSSQVASTSTASTGSATATSISENKGHQSLKVSETIVGFVLLPLVTAMMVFILPFLF